MAEQQKKPVTQPDRESRDSGIVSPEKNKIVDEHFREHPEGDPAVRRIKPDHGEIPTEETHDGIMTVREKKKDDDEKKKRAS